MSGAEGGGKRAASSPLSDAEDKRPCLNESITVDPDATIISGPPSKAAVLASDVKEALTDPDVLRIIASAVASKLTGTLQTEIDGLRKQLADKEKEIAALRNNVDSLEQYSRRNCLRIGPIPESSTEDTDAIVFKVAESAGVTLPDDAIDRSHRVGKKPSTTETHSRSILVKFTSYKHKDALVKNRKKLSAVDGAELFPSDDWPPLPATSNSDRPPKHRIFLNEDLTRARSQVAARARQLKRDKKIDDTWVKDGAIFVKCGDTRLTFTSIPDLEQFASRL
jgi:exosome complex exonuclease DIS3/RRP44